MKTQEIIVNNKKYILTKLNAIDGLKLKVRVTKVLASALGGIDNISKDEMSKVMEQDVASLVGKLAQAVERVDEDKYVNLIIDLLSKNIMQVKKADDSTTAEVPLVVNNLEIMDMYEIAIEVIKLNLGKFINDVKSKLNKNKATTKIESLI